MVKFIFKRILIAFLVLWVVATLTYFMVHVSPGDTANAIIISIYGEDVVTEETLTRVREKYDLEKPIFNQYATWLVNTFKGDFGTSYKYNKPVIEMLIARLPNTVTLGLVAFFISILIAIPLGIFSALYHNKLLDHISRTVTMLFSSFPSFWVGIVLIIFFSIQLRLLPVSGMNGPTSIILPALTLSVGMMATVIRMMRTSMLDVKGQDYVWVAKSKGIGETNVINRHILRNALPPIITVLGLQIGHLLGGAVVVESLFAWPGVGSLLLDAINTKDVPMIEGCVILISFGYSIINLIVDIIYAFIDPRVKYAEGKKE